MNVSVVSLFDLSHISAKVLPLQVIIDTLDGDVSLMLMYFDYVFPLEIFFGFALNLYRRFSAIFGDT